VEGRIATGGLSVVLGLSSAACGLLFDPRSRTDTSFEGVDGSPGNADADIDARIPRDATVELDVVAPPDAPLDIDIDATIPPDATAPRDATVELDAVPLPDATHGMDAFDARMVVEAGRVDAMADDAGPPVLRGGCRCGDGLVGPGEACDVGPFPSVSCSTTCTVASGASCVVRPVPWIFPSPTGVGPPGSVGGWSWTGFGTMALMSGLAYATDELTCSPGDPGYLVRGITASALPGCAQWVSQVSGGCGSTVAAATDVTYRTTFLAPVEGQVVLGIGWDNYLVDVRVDGRELVVEERGAGLARDGWPAPQAFVRFTVEVGEHELAIRVLEVQGPSMLNNSGISVMQVNPSVCTRP